MSTLIWLGISIAVLVLLWTNKDTLIALIKKADTPKPISGTTVPNSGMASQVPVGKTVPGTSIPENGILEAYLRPGSGNVQASTENLKPTDAKASWRTDLLIDQPGYWKTPAGKTDYTVKASGGDIVRFLVGPADEGMGNGKLSARGLEQAITNGYGNIGFQAVDETTVLTVETDKPVLLQRV